MKILSIFLHCLDLQRKSASNFYKKTKIATKIFQLEEHGFLINPWSDKEYNSCERTCHFVNKVSSTVQLNKWFNQELGTVDINAWSRSFVNLQIDLIFFDILHGNRTQSGVKESFDQRRKNWYEEIYHWFWNTGCPQWKSILKHLVLWVSNSKDSSSKVRIYIKSIIKKEIKEKTEWSKG